MSENEQESMGESYREMVRSAQKLKTLMDELDGDVLTKSDLPDPYLRPTPNPLSTVPHIDDDTNHDPGDGQFISDKILQFTTTDRNISNRDIRQFFATSNINVFIRCRKKRFCDDLHAKVVDIDIMFDSFDDLLIALSSHGQKINGTTFYLGTVVGRLKIYHMDGLDSLLPTRSVDRLRDFLMEVFYECAIERIILPISKETKSRLSFGYMIVRDGEGKDPVSPRFSLSSSFRVKFFTELMKSSDVVEI